MMRRLGLSARAGVVVGVCCAAACGAGVYFGHRHEGRLAERARADRVTSMALVLTDLLRGEDWGTGDAAGVFCKKLVRAGVVSGICVLDQEGRELASVSSGESAKRALQGEGDETTAIAGATGWYGVFDAGDGLVRVEAPLGSHPIVERPCRLVAVIDEGRFLAGAAGWEGWWWAAPIGAGLAAGLLGWWALIRAIVRPVRQIASRVRSSREEDGEAVDDFETISEAISSLRSELGRWRSRAASMELSIDQRVAEETRGIRRDLIRTRRESRLDALTGAMNRRMLDSELPGQFEACAREGRDLSMVMIDLDHFKQLNDAEGHACGDAVLAMTGRLLRECMERDQIAVRYGGDEFLLILPGVSAEGAEQLGKRLAAHFAQQARVMSRSRPSPTMSVGVSSYRKDAPKTAKELVEQADRRLYRAKLASRQRGKHRKSEETGENESKKGPCRRWIESTRGVVSL